MASNKQQINWEKLKKSTGKLGMRFLGVEDQVKDESELHEIPFVRLFNLWFC